MIRVAMSQKGKSWMDYNLLCILSPSVHYFEYTRGFHTSPLFYSSKELVYNILSIPTPGTQIDNKFQVYPNSIVVNKVSCL